MGAKKPAIFFGILFMLIGIVGFLGGFGIVGPEGFFATDSVHDWVHFLSGALFLLITFIIPRYSAIVLMVFGVVYGLVAIAGFMTGETTVLGMLINNPDDYLHIGLALATLFMGYIDRD